MSLSILLTCFNETPTLFRSYERIVQFIFVQQRALLRLQRGDK